MYGSKNMGYLKVFLLLNGYSRWNEVWKTRGMYVLRQLQSLSEVGERKLKGLCDANLYTVFKNRKGIFGSIEFLKK